MFKTKFAVIKSFLNNDWDIIFTTVEPSQEKVAKLLEFFSEYKVSLIYIKANKETVENREKERGDRIVGHAINLLDEFDSFNLHNLTVDTSQKSPKNCAHLIKSHLY